MKSKLLFQSVATLVLLCISSIGYAQYTPFTAQELQLFQKYKKPGYKVLRVAKTAYTTTGKQARETTYDNEKGKIKFSIEDRYYYDSQDSLYQMDRYDEIPNANSKQLQSLRYFTDKNGYAYLTIDRVDNEQIDSIWTTYTLDEKGKNPIMIKDSTQHYYEKKLISKKVEQQFFTWNQNNKLLKEISLENKDTLSIVTNEYFPNGNLKKKTMDNRDFGFIETYEYTYDDKGLLKEEVNYKSIEPDLKFTNQYFYDNQKRLVKELMYNNGKLNYTYLTAYNPKGQKTSYTMKGTNGDVGITYYLYDTKGRQQYKVDVSNIKQSKPIQVQETQTGVATYEEAAPPPPMEPAKQNTSTTEIIQEVDTIAKFETVTYPNFNNYFGKTFDTTILKKSENFTITFIVEKDGSMTYKDCTSQNEEIVKEVKRILKKSPHWEPAIVNNKTVRSLYRLPVRLVVN